MRNILTNIRSSQATVRTYDAETIAYMTAVGIPNDSATYYSTLKNSDVWDIIDTYVKAEKANGSFEMFDYPMIGNTAAQHSYNLVDTSKYQITWYGGWIHSELGAKGNGTNTYGLTGFVPADEQDVYSNGLSYVSGTDLTEIKAEPIQMGVGGASNSRSLILVNKSGSPSMRTRMNNNAIDGSTSTNSGVVTSVRQSDLVTKLFKNGSLLGSGNSGGVLPPYEVFLGTYGTNGIPSSNYSLQRFQGFKAHIGLTDTQVSQHHANVDAREAALLRKNW